LKINAPAKLNLFLEVLSKRKDDYHNIETVMVPVSLFDEITVDESDKVSVECDNKLLSGKNNLAFKAVLQLKSIFPGKIKGASVYIKKRIPVAAGLGGGSSDCAAVLKAVNNIYNLALSSRELKEIGVKLGADVPYFIDTQASLCHGIGDEIKPLKIASKLSFVLINPQVELPTYSVYSSLKTNLTQKPKSINMLLHGLYKGDMADIVNGMFNRLQDICEKKVPIVRELMAVLCEKGALKAMVSGSGPTVFGVCGTPDDAERIKKEICGNLNFECSVFSVESI